MRVLSLNSLFPPAVYPDAGLPSSVIIGESQPTVRGHTLTRYPPLPAGGCVPPLDPSKSSKAAEESQ